MRYRRFGIMAISLVTAVLSGVGCCTVEKNKIAALQNDKNELVTTKKSLQKETETLKKSKQDLWDQLDAREAELLAANQKIADLQAKATTKPAGTKRGEWDVGLHADRVTLTGDILFASGKATLTAAGRARLNRLIATLRAKYAGMPVRVYGYTDTDPIRVTRKLWRDNLDLSANRAMAVTRHLRAARIPAEQIETVGMGQTRPVASNSNKAGKAKNRRVEIVVIKK